MQNLQYFSNDLQKSTKLGCQLIRTHASEGRLREAAKVFDSLEKKNVYAWTALISAYLHHDKRDEAFLLYKRMRSEGVVPSSYTYVTVLKALSGRSDLNAARLLHYQIVHEDCRADNFVENGLIYMYASCACVEDAWDVFSKLSGRADDISWGSLIAGYAQHGHGHEALQFFQRMVQADTVPNKFTLICLLKSCTDVSTLWEARLLHGLILKQSCEGDKFIACSLLNLYAKYGSIEDALKVFEGLRPCNVVACSSMILCYAEHEHEAKAIDLFNQMVSWGVVPNDVTFVCVLKACWKLSAHDAGKDIHLFIVKLGVFLDVLIGSTLIGMYSSCGKLDDARKVFDGLAERNVVCWSTIISGYEECSNNAEAMQLYNVMQVEGVQADGFLYVIILNVCINLKALEEGKAIHSEITKVGLESDLFVGSNLVDMYAKCGTLSDALVIFNKLSAQDVVSWSGLIEGLAMHGYEEEAVRYFNDMLNNCVEPNEVTFLSLFKACTGLLDLRLGNIAYMYCIEMGLESNRAIGNTLVDMYAKCNTLENAHRVFDKLLAPDVVSWNALIGGYASKGYDWEALQLSEKLQGKGLVDVNDFTIMAILKACSSMAVANHGKLIHAELVKRGFEKLMAIHNSLINMYAKCGSLLDAHKIFDTPPAHSSVSWNAMIGGYADHGKIKEVELCFANMQTYNIQPDEVTFICLLAAYNHAGSTQEGYFVVQLMEYEYSQVPKIQHFICLVDILGRAGCLDEAEGVVLKIPFEPDCFIWMSLLGSCEKHGYSQQGMEFFDYFVQEADVSAAAYVLVSNMFVANFSG